jgi:hypothetical protein
MQAHAIDKEHLLLVENDTLVALNNDGSISVRGAVIDFERQGNRTFQRGEILRRRSLTFELRKLLP